MDSIRLEKICSKIASQPDYVLHRNGDMIYADIEGFRFQLYKTETDEAVNLEGGTIIGEGEHSEMVHNLRIPVKTSYVTLSVIEPASHCEIERYMQSGESVDINWVDGAGKPSSRPLLLETYKSLRTRVDTLERNKGSLSKARVIEEGKKRLDDILN